MEHKALQIPKGERLAHRLVVPSLLLANIALACGPWLVRLAETESHVGPLASAFWRLTLAFPLLLVASARAGTRQPWHRAGLVGLALLAGLFFAADLAAWHIGILATRLGNATLLGNVTALLFPIYGFLRARRWPTRLQVIALLLACAGAVLLLGRSYQLSSRGLLGDLSCLFAGLCYTLYLIAVQRTRSAFAPLPTLTLAVAAGIPCLLLAAWIMGESIWPQAWTPLILLALGSQIVGQGLLLFAVSRATPLLVGTMLLIQPVVSAAIGWSLYGERLTGLDLIGAIAIAAAVLLVRERHRA